MSDSNQKTKAKRSNAGSFSAAVIFGNAWKQKRLRNLLVGLYVLAIIGLSAAARAEATSDPLVGLSPGQSSDLKTFVGQLILSADGQFFLANESSTYELRSSSDLSAWNGSEVQVLGKELKYKVGPVYQLQAVNPLQTDGERLPVAPVVVVYDIKVIQQ